MFSNATGVAANELHIVFRNGVVLDSVGAFAGGDGDRARYDLTGATVQPGEDVKMTARSAGAVHTGVGIERWWWANDGKRAGGVQRDSVQTLFTTAGGGDVLFVMADDDGGDSADTPNTPHTQEVQLDDAQGGVFTTTLDVDCTGSFSGGAMSISFALVKPDVDAVGGDVVSSGEAIEASAVAAKVDEDAADEGVMVWAGANGATEIKLDCLTLVAGDAAELDPSVQTLEPLVFETLRSTAIPSPWMPTCRRSEPMVLNFTAGQIGMTMTLVMDGVTTAASPEPVLIDATYLHNLFEAMGTGDPMFDLDNDGAVDASDIKAAIGVFGTEIVPPSMGN